MTRRHVIVRYRVRPEHVERNAVLVRAVYEELARVGPPGLRYATYRLEDGRTFVHHAEIDGDGDSPLPGLPAFRAFLDGLRERCDEPPVASAADVVGAFTGRPEVRAAGEPSAA